MQSTVWYERYKPQTLDDVVLPDSIKTALRKNITDGTLPNLGFWSADPGLGKSSTANAIVSELEKLGHEAMWVNASLEKGIDVLRGKIKQFAVSQSVDGNFKVVVLDECLEEHEEVVLLENGKEKYTALRDLEKNKVYDCLSMNLETHEIEQDTCEVVSDKEDDIYEIELEDGRTILVTANHPMIVNNHENYISKSIDDGLSVGDDLVCRD